MLKFQAWDDSFARMDQGPIFDEADKRVYSRLFACDGYLGENLTNMQSTGPKDIKDTEIYEGDVLKYWGDHRPAVAHDSPFGWIPGLYYIPFLIGCISRISNNEVVGNIYRNKEEKRAKDYQVQHDNCDLWDDSYSCREDKKVTSKEQLIKDIKSRGYLELQGKSRNHYIVIYLKHVDEVPHDSFTIDEIEFIDNK
ncbi:putative YpoX protein II [Staphylococcus phage vB_SauH_DELF3]|nr:putative YpoX protein II [Staphylococcus phage vB_SauH_DELF3]